MARQGPTVADTLAKIQATFGEPTPTPTPISFKSGPTGLFQMPSHMINSEIEFSPTVAVIQRQFNKLGGNIRSFKKPLTDAIDKVLSPSFVRNFDVGGRPTWAPLTDYTLAIKENQGFGPEPLIRTGRLRSVAGQRSIWHIDGGYNKENARAFVKGMPARAWYGAVHQGGLRSVGRKIDIPIFGSGAAQLPERPFVVAQREDLGKIQAIFAEYYRERINADLPLRSRKF